MPWNIEQNRTQGYGSDLEKLHKKAKGSDQVSKNYEKLKKNVWTVQMDSDFEEHLQDLQEIKRKQKLIGKLNI